MTPPQAEPCDERRARRGGTNHNDLSDLDSTVGRLLRNQTDIGDAIKPHYGDAAGERLTRLPEGHINGARLAWDLDWV